MLTITLRNERRMHLGRHSDMAISSKLHSCGHQAQENDRKVVAAVVGGGKFRRSVDGESRIGLSSEGKQRSIRNEDQRRIPVAREIAPRRSFDGGNDHKVAGSGELGERSTDRSKENRGYEGNNKGRFSSNAVYVAAPLTVSELIEKNSVGKQTQRFQQRGNGIGRSPEKAHKEQEKLEIETEPCERVEVEWDLRTPPREPPGGLDMGTEKNFVRPRRLKKSASARNATNVQPSKEFLFSKFFEANQESPNASPRRPMPGSTKSSMLIDLDNVVPSKQLVQKILRRQKAFDERELGKALGCSVDTLIADTMQPNVPLAKSAAGTRTSPPPQQQPQQDKVKSLQREPGEISRNQELLLMSAKKAAAADRQRFFRALRDQDTTQSSSSIPIASSPEQNLARGNNTPDASVPARKGHRSCSPTTSPVNAQYDGSSSSGNTVRVVKENAIEGSRDFVSQSSFRTRAVSQSVDRDDNRFYETPTKEEFKVREAVRESPISKRVPRQGAIEAQARSAEPASSGASRIESNGRRLSVLEKLHLGVTDGKDSNPALTESEEAGAGFNRSFRGTGRSALHASFDSRREPLNIANSLPKDINVPQKGISSEMRSGDQLSRRELTDDRASAFQKSGMKVQNWQAEQQSLQGPSKIEQLLQKKNLKKTDEAGDSYRRVENFDKPSKITSLSKLHSATPPSSTFPAEGHSEDTNNRQQQFRKSNSSRRLQAVAGSSVPRRSTSTGDFGGLSRGTTQWNLDEELSTPSDSNSCASYSSPAGSPSPQSSITDEEELASLHSQSIHCNSDTTLHRQSEYFNPDQQKACPGTWSPNSEEGARSIGETSRLSGSSSPLEENLSPLELKLQELQRRVNDRKQNKITRETLIRSRSLESSQYDISTIEHTAIVRYEGAASPSDDQNRIESAIVKYQETGSWPKDDNSKGKAAKLPPEVVTFEPPIIKNSARSFVDGAIDIDEIPCAESRIHDLAYVRDVLVASGFTRKDSETSRKWHSSYPIDPALFDKLEKYRENGATFLGDGLPHFNIKRPSAKPATSGVNGRVETTNRCLLFDVINDILARKLRPYKTASQPWKVLPKPVLRPRPVGKLLVREVWEEICELGGLKSGRLTADKAALTASLEALIARDLQKDQRWLRTDDILEKLCVDLENQILRGVIEDTVLSLYYLSSKTLACQQISR